MNKLVFESTMRGLFPEIEKIGESGAVNIGEMQIRLGLTNVKISGNFPYQFAMNLYEKYPHVDIKPGTIGIDSPIPYFKEKYRAKYIDKYRVGTKEGLIVFVCEYLDYCDQLLRKPSERSAHIPELVDEVNTILLRKINPVQSNRAWMAESMYSQEYFDGLLRGDSRPAIQEFLRVLDEFDRTVNPFIEEDMSLEEKVKRLQGQEISFYPLSYDSSFDDDAQFYITTIEDSHSGSEVKFGRRPNGFNSVLFAIVGEQDFFSVQHAYSSSASKEEEQGEIVRIAYSGDNCLKKKSILFNLTKGILVKDNRTIVLDDLQLGLLYRELQKAISFASTITVDHFKQKKTIQFKPE